MQGPGSGIQTVPSPTRLTAPDELEYEPGWHTLQLEAPAARPQTAVTVRLEEGSTPYSSTQASHLDLKGAAA